MKAWLEKNPHQGFEFDDDAQIKQLIVELGLAGRFQNKPRGPKETVQSVLLTTHGTHFILIALYLGYAQPKDNGYLCVCLPKSRITDEQFTKFAKNFLNPDNKQPLHAEGFDERPPKN